MSNPNLNPQYLLGQLELEDLDPDPVAQLKAWLDDAVAKQVREPHAMCLSTISPDLRPHGRMVLMRDLDGRGLTFCTNFESQKGDDLQVTPFAAVCFWWADLERQVRVEGRIDQVSDAESDDYFNARPLASRFTSVASPQSKRIGSRAEVERKAAALASNYPDGPPRPVHWGGYRLNPTHFEFWQGREARLHDRFLYERHSEGWTIVRLAP